MRAVSPVIPEANERERTYAEDHSVYLPLPSLKREDGVVLTRWLLTQEELELVLRQGYLYLAVITDGKSIQPMKLTVTIPEEFKNYQPVDDEWPTEVNG